MYCVWDHDVRLDDVDLPRYFSGGIEHLPRSSSSPTGSLDAPFTVVVVVDLDIYSVLMRNGFNFQPAAKRACLVGVLCHWPC
jgi:hypothetical protein